MDNVKHIILPVVKSKPLTFFLSLPIRLTKHEAGVDGEATPMAGLYLWFPYVLFVEAFLAFLPFLIYSGNTRAIISPILNEARDMALVTSGQFEGMSTCEKKELHCFRESFNAFKQI